MLLIISNNYEQSTSEVAEWLLYYRANFKILTEINAVKSLFYINGQKKDIKIKTTNKDDINFDCIKTVWYRRGKINNANTPVEIQNDSPQGIDYFQRIVKAEWDAIQDLLLLSLNNKMRIGNYFKRDPNKLEVLKIAEEVGLKVPKTLITTEKQAIETIFRQCRIINKNIFNIAYKVINDKLYYNRTIEINICNLPDTFFPSLFQELIIKKYELRIFFLNNQFFTSAIFSQQDSKTEVDFRNYNHVKPNRVVPFSLPNKIEKRLNKLMKVLKLNSGSIDMLVTTKDEFIFLEINPDGQFGMVSIPCNYFLERHIAKTLQNGKS